jgi:hypothetical protein
MDAKCFNKDVSIAGYQSVQARIDWTLATAVNPMQREIQKQPRLWP